MGVWDAQGGEKAARFAVGLLSVTLVKYPKRMARGVSGGGGFGSSGGLWALETTCIISNGLWEGAARRVVFPGGGCLLSSLDGGAGWIMRHTFGR